jgi:predicted ATP-binding protein involved in virulence
MFLQRLTLKDVRSIEHLDLPAGDGDGGTRKWTFLLGENGCGKSTLLRAAALVLAGSDALSELLVDPESWIRLGCETALIEAVLVTARGEERTVRLELRRGASLLELFERNRTSLKKLDDALRHTPRNYLTVGYGVSRRLADPRYASSRNGNPFSKPRARSVATLFSPDAELNPLQTWAVDLHYRREAEGLRLIEQTLRHLLPGVEFAGIDRESQQLLFHTAEGDLPLRLLSDGYQNMAAWCGDLLYTITQAFGDYDDPLAARGLLLIDKIDLHLHPVWQRQLKAFLDDKLPHFQILATTHSPLTAHQAGDGELFFLRREGERQSPVLHRYEGSPQKLMIHQLLMSPAFGLSTMDSQRVESMRREYEDLRVRSVRTRQEEKRLRQLTVELPDLPEFDARTDLDLRRAAALGEIAQALQSKE